MGPASNRLAFLAHDRGNFRDNEGEDARDVKHPEPGEPVDEIAFRWVMNRDAMAAESLAEGIGTFASDLETLRTEMRQRLGAAA
jgi:transaldolase